ncbi:ATP-binding protein [Winogradskyella sp.]|uniref:sensor histidine kinase n=1 Tax=Winogradskyella sp. TaxID=1883156 RepID=UPI001B23AABE|nr:ATP-binding protein [Winogradskyella sp.]MBO6879210.1 two-component sensor histidine kinase [Winogradskyella sp.]
MNDKRYQWILYIIIAVIAITIGIQVFWNYKNYQTNKQQLIRDVQISLDKAVDDYYASLAKETSFAFTTNKSLPHQFLQNDSILSSHIETYEIHSDSLDLINAKNIETLRVIKGSKSDSLKFSFPNDSLNIQNIEWLTTKVYISLRNDSLDVRKVNKLLYEDLQRKNLDLDHQLDYYHNVPDKALIEKNNKRKAKILGIDPNEHNIYVESKSTFLPENSVLKLGFSNETRSILKRSLGGILISILLVLAIISSLFYLLRIIKHQKQLAEVKNDLISNITHEFKTPIATIGVALESINNFNAIEDKEKTKKYINMSSEQLGKLNLMVEKLLETATLDSDNLELNKESIDCVELLNSLVNRYKIQYPEKTFNTSFKVESLKANVDIFHFENALNNILDNAVKYGGELISIDLVPKKDMFNILISDNGNTLSKENKERIFEKFYRVPKGNTHDVKGFGIGLYYTKTIIEKHNGSISLDLNKNLTTFKITLPNG